MAPSLLQRASMRLLVMLFVALMAPTASSYTLDTSNPSPTNATGLWWNANEAGWGVTITQQSTIIFATMFTYDGKGSPNWYVSSNCPVSGAGCTGDLYRMSGGSPPTGPWNAASLYAGKVGTLTLTFSDINSGTMSYTIDGVAWSKTITRNLFAPSSPPVTGNYAMTARLIGGTWTYTYTILSTWNDSYSFTTMSSTPDSNGNYAAAGKDAYGNLVVGMYDGRSGQWGVLDQGTIIDQFYMFTFVDNNRVSGCYYQINPPGSTNMSRCYSMTGTRNPPKAVTTKSPPELLVREAAQDMSTGFVEPGALDAYLSLRKSLQ